MRIVFVSLLILSGLFVQAQDVLTPEVLWQFHRIYGAEVSPDEKQIIYIERAYELEADKGSSSLKIMPAGGGDAKDITPKEGSLISAMWRPDGKKIAFLSTQSGSVQLWEMNPDGSEISQVTDLPYSIDNVHYAPDLGHISYTYTVKVNETASDRHPDLPMATGRTYDDLMVRHWTAWYDGTHSHVGISAYTSGKASGLPVDIMDGEPFDSPMKPFGGAEQMTWSPDGKKFVYTCKKLFGKEYAVSTNSDLYSYDVETGETTNITKGRMGYDMDPVFSPNGSMMAWMSMERNGFESDKNVVWLMDTKTGQRKALTGNVDQSFGSLCWAANGKTIYATSGVDATYQAYRIDLTSTNFSKASLKAVSSITKGQHNVNGVALAGGRLVGTKNTMTTPAELYSWDIATGDEQQLTKANTAMVDKLSSATVEKRMIKTTDGKDMLTWVIYPPDFDASKKYPTLLYCQGGPQSAVSQFFSYRWNFALMASQGYIVVAPNRRGLPTFGQEWNDQISKDWGGQAMKDYLSAIDAMKEEPFIDNDRIGAVGASYGGYSVYYLAGIHEGRFKSFISHCGLFNLESWYGATEELFFANWDIGGPYWEDPQPESYNLFSPHSLVKNWDTPILVIHNELDFRVPLNQGLEAFTAAKLKGLNSKLLYYPDEGHWVLKPQNGVMWHREFFGWLDETLK